MGGFSVYNQIKIDPFDTEKTALWTPMKNFHYIVILFELKNPGATYQQAMSTLFMMYCMVSSKST